MLETMTHNTTHTTTTADGVDVESPAADTLYLIRAMDPNGEKHGVYAPRPPCPVDEHCPLAARHGAGNLALFFLRRFSDLRKS